MAVSTAERNRRKRERKKRERERRKKDEEVQQQEAKKEENETNSEKNETSETKQTPFGLDSVSDDEAAEAEEVEIEVEYVPEPLPPIIVSSSESSRTVAAVTSEDVETASPTPFPRTITSSGGEQQHHAPVSSEDGTVAADTASKHANPKDDDNNDTENDNPMKQIQIAMQRFNSRAGGGYVSSGAGELTDREREHAQDDEGEPRAVSSSDDDDDGIDQDESSKLTEKQKVLSRRKLRERLRPTVSELKQRVTRSDLVEAHDVTAADPDFLIFLKSQPGTVPVPRHWGRKRKYLQGKRGIEKAPFQLPDFIAKTGIAEIRGAAAEQEDKMTLKQKQRLRVSARGGGGSVDVDYKTLHDAFFRYQTRPKNLTKFGDLYYEGKEFEQRSKKEQFIPGKLSDTLREALGMISDNSPPPWLLNMQRYGPPPAYPNLKIPGLNAPLPQGCSYGYHVGGWGKPPVDAYGRGLYGDVFGQPGARDDGDGADSGADLITSDGKTLFGGKKFWGSLPSAGLVVEEEEEESSSEEEEESSSEEESEAEEDDVEKVAKGNEGEENAATAAAVSGTESVIPPLPPPGGADSVLPPTPSSALDLRKAPGAGGDETPAPQQLYQVLETTTTGAAGKQTGAIFKSEQTYVLPGGTAAGTAGEGAESVLSKAPMSETSAGKRRRGADEDEGDDLGKKFKF